LGKVISFLPFVRKSKFLKWFVKIGDYNHFIYLAYELLFKKLDLSTGLDNGLKSSRGKEDDRL
jgi:hypothetical protein